MEWNTVAHGVVPASEGWRMLSLGWDGELEEHEIIAWSVQVAENKGRAGVRTRSVPVTIGPYRTDDWVIRRPNGTMFTPYEEFGTEKESAIEYLKKADEDFRKELKLVKGGNNAND